MRQLINADIHHIWLPQGETKAVVICVHGLGLHGGCYHHLGTTLSANGFAVLAIDIRGLGCWRSWGDHSLDISGCLADLQAALTELRNLYPYLPLFLAGESLGGAIALKCASQNAHLVDGLIMSSPAIDSSRHFFNHWELWLKHYLAPNRRVSLIKALIERAEADEELRQLWLDDHLACKEVYVRDLIAMRNLLNDNDLSARMLRKTPVLVLQGYGDRLFVPRDTLSLFERLTTSEKELVYIGNAEHLMLQSRRQDHRGLSVLMGWMEIVVTKLRKRDLSALPAPFCELRLVNHFASPDGSRGEPHGEQQQRAA
ncbi:MAG: alpha/beta fold hydrolase [Candidatus Obscuribacterales bacterium]